MVKTLFESVKLYWGYFSTLLAIGSFVWVLGVKSERKNIEGVNVKEDVAEIKQIQKEQSQQLDSIYAIVNKLREKQFQLIEGQNALRESWVKYLANNKDLKLEDFLKYMEGLEFQITPDPGAPKPEFKIGIKKVQQK